MPLHHPHLDALREALKSEEHHARAEWSRIGGLPLDERVEQGASWTGLRFERIAAFRKRELRVVARGVLHEGISSGDAVMVNGHHGRCVGWDPTVAELSFDKVHWDEIASAVTVDLGFDASTWVEYRKALERADEAESPLRDALLAGVSDEERTGRHVSPPQELDWLELNESQAVAANAAFNAPHLAVIHGPPGTGKTRTLVALLDRLSGVRWALAESNAAVDNLALGAAAAGMKVARVGPLHRMTGPIRELSVDQQMLDGPWSAALKAIDRDISRAADGPDKWKLFDQRRELRDVARSAVLDNADVIATTFGSLARRAEELPPADIAVVDEVTQAIEPAVWAAVPHVQRLVLAGDPHQLGPVVLEPGNILEHGILDRLQVLDVPMPMLRTQHRMNATIMELVRRVYGDDYGAHDSVASHRLSDLDGVVAGSAPTSWPPALFVDTAGMGEEERDPVSQSVFNTTEVGVVAVALAQLRDAGVSPDRIGVIAPYSAQVSRLGSLPEADGIEVATVNAFQGREAEVIVMSFTRSNADGELGFLADRRRLTVAITRARRLLLMVGDTATLGRNSDFAELLDNVAQLDDAELHSIWQPPWDAALPD